MCLFNAYVFRVGINWENPPRNALAEPNRLVKRAIEQWAPLGCQTNVVKVAGVQ